MRNQRLKQIWFEITKRRKILEQNQDIKDLNIYPISKAIKSQSEIEEDEEFYTSER